MGNGLGVPVVVMVAVCEHEPDSSAVAPALQQAHTPEHALVVRPVVEPNVPAGQSVGEPEPARQYDPMGLHCGGEGARGVTAGHGSSLRTLTR